MKWCRVHREQVDCERSMECGLCCDYYKPYKFNQYNYYYYGAAESTKVTKGVNEVSNQIEK